MIPAWLWFSFSMTIYLRSTLTASLSDETASAEIHQALQTKFLPPEGMGADGCRKGLNRGERGGVGVQGGGWEGYGCDGQNQAGTECPGQEGPGCPPRHPHSVSAVTPQLRDWGSRASGKPKRKDQESQPPPPLQMGSQEVGCYCDK